MPHHAARALGELSPTRRRRQHPERRHGRRPKRQVSPRRRHTADAAIDQPAGQQRLAVIDAPTKHLQDLVPQRAGRGDQPNPLGQRIHNMSSSTPTPPASARRCSPPRSATTPSSTATASTTPPPPTSSPAPPAPRSKAAGPPRCASGTARSCCSIDELGYLPLPGEAASHLFQVISRRYEHGIDRPDHQPRHRRLGPRSSKTPPSPPPSSTASCTTPPCSRSPATATACAATATPSHALRPALTGRPPGGEFSRSHVGNSRDP